MDSKTAKRVKELNADIAAGLESSDEEDREKARIAHAALNKILDERDAEADSAIIDLDTGLPNKRALVQRDALMRAQPPAAHVSYAGEEKRIDIPKPVLGYWVNYIDFDGFKLVNDAISHDNGDRAMIIFAAALRSSTREQDEIYRLGGDEFGVVAPVTEVPAEDFRFKNNLKSNLQDSVQKIIAEGSEFLPEGFEINSEDLEVLDYLEMTIGDTYIEGPVLSRVDAMKVAEQDMSAQKNH